MKVNDTICVCVYMCTLWWWYTRNHAIWFGVNNVMNYYYYIFLWTNTPLPVCYYIYKKKKNCYFVLFGCKLMTIK